MSRSKLESYLVTGNDVNRTAYAAVQPRVAQSSAAQ